MSGLPLKNRDYLSKETRPPLSSSSKTLPELKNGLYAGIFLNETAVERKTGDLVKQNGGKSCGNRKEPSWEKIEEKTRLKRRPGRNEVFGSVVW